MPGESIRVLSKNTIELGDITYLRQAARVFSYYLFRESARCEDIINQLLPAEITASVMYIRCTCM